MMEKLEQCVNLFKINNKKHQNDDSDVVLVSLLLILNRFHTYCSHITIVNLGEVKASSKCSSSFQYLGVFYR